MKTEKGKEKTIQKQWGWDWENAVTRLCKPSIFRFGPREHRGREQVIPVNCPDLPVASDTEALLKIQPEEQPAMTS